MTLTIRKLTVVAVAAMLAWACGSDSSSAPSVTCNNNGTLDTGEECDGTQFGGETCATQTTNTKPNGSLTCTGCVIDSTACRGVGGGSGTGAAGGI